MTLPSLASALDQGEQTAVHRPFLYEPGAKTGFHSLNQLKRNRKKNAITGENDTSSCQGDRVAAMPTPDLDNRGHPSAASDGETGRTESMETDEPGALL